MALDGFTFTWQDRRLAGAVSDNLNISYTYNYDGIRTGKTVNGITTSYTVDESNNVVSQSDGTNTLQFVYDSNNAPVYMVYNGTTYYYEKNLQGDVVGLLDEQGNLVVQYSYDVWGRLLSISGTLSNTVGLANPLRYCGYYYDTETQLYYLQSRYYSPEIIRFISQDSPYYSIAQGLPLGSNLYIYCSNNPIMYMDQTGESLTVAILIGVGIGALIGSGIAIYKGYKIKSWKFWGWTAGGAVIGGLTAAGGWVLFTLKSPLSAWGAYKASQIAAGLGTSSAAIGRMFEKFYYGFYNIAEKYQQVVYRGYRFDAIYKNKIIELKNYTWSNYNPSQIRSISNQFVEQATNYKVAVGQTIAGQKIKGIVFYFSSKPPGDIIKALEKINNVVVDWAR